VRPDDLPSWIETTTAADDTALAEFYNRCAVFLVPSRGEGFGLPALEAMACGAAVVSTDNGGVRDYARPGENILLAPVGDTAAMADQLELLLTDDELRRRMAAAGRSTAEQISWDVAIDALEGVLAGL
jgi:glycosyltransferase involved in cell wall biosynthesis